MPVRAPEWEAPTYYRPEQWETRSPARRLRRGRGGLAVPLLVVAAITLGWVGLHHLGDLLPDWHNPFRTVEVDRTGSAVLKALDDLHEYRAATGGYEVLVDIEKDAKYLPAFLKGERSLFLAQGSVEAGVDFSGLGPESVAVHPDGSVTIILPHARLAKPTLDTAASHVVDRDRGLFDRVGSMFSDSPTSEAGLYAAARAKLRAAADEGALVARAEENTTQMLDRLLGAIGVGTVEVTFADNPT